MNSVIFSLTLRELTAQRRLLLMVLLSAVPLALAAIYSLGDQIDQADWTSGMLEAVGVTVVLPLVCLILGASALGSEIDEGTAVYLLAKPIPRLHVITAKFAASALLAAALVVPAVGLAGILGMSGVPGERLAPAFAAGVALGVVAYTALFIFLSVLTSRALLIGLAYVFIWEGLITNLFGAVAYLSIREYCLGIADSISTAREFEAEIGAAEALPLLAAVTIGALYLATRRLERIELTESE